MGCCSSSDFSQQATFLLEQAIAGGFCNDRIVLVTASELDAAIACAAASFRGSATTPPEGVMDWILGAQYREQWENSNRNSVFHWFLHIVGQSTVWYGGCVFAIKDDGGEMGAVLMLRPPGSIRNGVSTPNPSLNFGCMYMKYTGDKTKFEEPYADSSFPDGPAVKRRCEFVGEVMDRMHAENAPEDHWYVHVMGVHPKHQGNRLCSSLMRFVNHLADSSGHPCYLETMGDKNIAIYERFGYSIRKDYELRDTEEGAEIITALTRPVQAK